MRTTTTLLLILVSCSHSQELAVRTRPVMEGKTQAGVLEFQPDHRRYLLEPCRYDHIAYTAKDSLHVPSMDLSIVTSLEYFPDIQMEHTVNELTFPAEGLGYYLMDPATGEPVQPIDEYERVHEGRIMTTIVYEYEGTALTPHTESLEIFDEYVRQTPLSHPLFRTNKK